MFDYDIQLHDKGKLESVLYFSDLHGGESILFVFPDETTDLLDQAAILGQNIPEHIVPLFLKRRELFQLSIPYPGPRQLPGAPRNLMTRGSFHIAGWAKCRSKLVYGRDIRTELTLPRWPARSLRHHLELGTDIVRNSTILCGLVFHRSLIRDLRELMDELMLSGLLATGEARWSREEIESRFREILPEAIPILDEYMKLEAEALGSNNDYSQAREYRLVWLFERFAMELQKFADGLPEDAAQTEANCNRYQYHNEKLKCTNGRPIRAGDLNYNDINPAFFGLKDEETAHYYDAIEVGLPDLREVREAVVSLEIYGSMARKTVRPGRSDICDAYLVLDDECFQNYADFERVLDAMVRSSIKMGQTSIPFHPFKYSSANDWSYRHPPLFLAEWGNDALSLVAFGDDIRPQAGSSSAGVIYARRTLFTHPLLSRRCARFLTRKDLSQNEMGLILKALSSGLKMIPRSMCAACDIWTSNAGALKHIAEIAPYLDVSLTETVDEMPVRSPGEVGVGEAIRNLRRMLDFIEDSCEATIKWLESHNELDHMLDV
jgi:hypothetical protein